MRLPAASSKLPLAWLMLFLLPLFGWLAWHQQQLTIDSTNQALKARGTQEAALAERIAESFGGESALVLAYFGKVAGALSKQQAAALDDLREDLRDHPSVRSVAPILEPQPGCAVLTAQLADPQTAPALIAFAREHCPADLEFLSSGIPAIEHAIATGVALDRMRMVPAITGALLVLLLLLYRSFSSALAILLPSCLAIAGTGGLLHLLGRQLDPVLVLLDPVLLTVGVATSVHFLGGFRRHRQLGCSPSVAAIRTSHEMRWPLILTTGTTMLGFGSLAINSMPAVADFGLFAVFGTGLVHALALLVLPRWFAAFPGPLPQPLATATHRAERATEWLLRHRLAILAATALLTIAAITGWTRLHVNNDPIAVLARNDPARISHDELCRRLGGAELFSLLIDRGSPAQAPERLLPFAGRILSTAPAAGPGGPLRRATDGTLMLPIRLQPSGSGARQEFFHSIEQTAQTLGWSGVHAAGLQVQIAADSNRLVRGQLQGLVLTVLGLGIGLLLGLHSWRLCLMGLVPTILPCLFLYGGLGLLDQPLTVANTMIGSCMLGLIVDNTIHLLHRFRHAQGTSRDRLHSALAAVGGPMMLSSAVLGIGFATGLCGSMTTTIQFGGLSATTIALASLCTGVVLPALLLALRHSTSSSASLTTQRAPAAPTAHSSRAAQP